MESAICKSGGAPIWVGRAGLSKRAGLETTLGRRVIVRAKMKLAGERRSRRARTPAAVAMTPFRVSIPLLRSYLPAADKALFRTTDGGPTRVRWNAATEGPTVLCGVPRWQTRGTPMDVLARASAYATHFWRLFTRKWTFRVSAGAKLQWLLRRLSGAKKLRGAHLVHCSARCPARRRRASRSAAAPS